MHGSRRNTPGRLRGDRITGSDNRRVRGLARPCVLSGTREYGVLAAHGRALEKLRFSKVASLVK